MIRPMPWLRRFFVVVPALLALSHASEARADKVLVYQAQTNNPLDGDTAGPAAAAILTGLGHTVTSQISIGATLPTDLSSFDSIWIISLVPLTGVQQTTLINYVRAGGGLYLTGERPCCQDINNGVQAILNTLTPDITQIGNQGEGGNLFQAAATDTWSITTTPNAVPTWLTGEAGLMNTVPAQNQVYNHPQGKTGAAAWTGEELKKAAGCVYAAMDLSWWFANVNPQQNKSLITENVQSFLGHCRDADNDGVSDPGEAAAGTNPADPDTDNDGLCDGYGTVTGVCVPGESIYEDNDNDGTFDPFDDDDDNDGIPTKDEIPAEQAKPDADEDKKPAWLDVDSDNNNIPDSVEGIHDYDNDGIPSIVDLGDDPDNCDEDADCQPPQGPICDQNTGFCSFGAGTGGTGGGAGQGGTGASSGAGGSGNAGGGSGGSGNAGGSGNSGGSSGAGGSGGSKSSGDSGDDGGCGCSTHERGRGAGYAALLALALLGARRRKLGHSV
jgi:MYXO-CTERM domain-containing protein